MMLVNSLPARRVPSVEKTYTDCPIIATIYLFPLLNWETVVEEAWTWLVYWVYIVCDFNVFVKVSSTKDIFSDETTIYFPSYSLFT